MVRNPAVRYPEREDRDERRRDRVGGDAPRPARQHRRPVRLRPILRRRRHASRPTCCNATSGSAPSTTRPPSTRASASASTTLMLEVDYPHGDSTWPDTQDVIEQYWGHLPVEELRKLTARERGGAVPLAPPGRTEAVSRRRRARAGAVDPKEIVDARLRPGFRSLRSLERRRGRQPARRRARARAPLVPSRTSALDLGCGTGWHATRYLAVEFARVIAVDISPKSIAAARDACPASSSSWAT